MNGDSGFLVDMGLELVLLGFRAGTSIGIYQSLLNPKKMTIH
jgi:hypothetical protein